MPDSTDDTPMQKGKPDTSAKKPANGVKKSTDEAKKAAGGTGKNTEIAEKDASPVEKHTGTAKKSAGTVKKEADTPEAGTAAGAVKKPRAAKKTAESPEKTAKKSANSAKTSEKATESPENAWENPASPTENHAEFGGEPADKTAGNSADKTAGNSAEGTGGAFPPVLWENTVPEEQNAHRMPGYTRNSSLPVSSGSGSPVPSGTREVGRASVPVDFPEGLTKKGVARRVLVLLLMVAVLVAAMAVFFFRPAEYTEKIGSVVCWYNEAENNSAVIADGKNIGTVPGRVTAKETDGRGYTALLLTDNGTLWLVRGGKLRTVSGDVTRAVLSAGGSALAFRTGTGALYRSGTGKKDTPALVSNEVADEPFCLSPDGKELLYTSGLGGTLRAELFSARGSAPYLTDTGNYRPVAIADKCRYIYFRDSDNILYIYTADTARMTNCGGFTEGTLVFNRDFSEVFFANGESCRFYKKGSSLTLTGLSAGETLTLLPNRRAAKRETVGGEQVLQKSLLGCYYNYAATGGSILVYLRAQKGAVAMDTIHFFDNGTATVTDKYVFFLSTDQTATDRRTNLYAVKNGKTEFTRLMADVAEYCTNVDGSRILYGDVHGPLRAMRMGSSPTQLADGFLSGTLRVTLDDVFYYRTGDGALYRSENGEMPEKVADGVRFAATDAHTAFFLRENGAEYELFSNYRGRRKNNRVAALPSLPSDDGEPAAE